MSRIVALAVVLVAGLLCGLPAGAADAPARRTNVVVILVDDLGYECLGANGGKSYRTPNVDALARTGVRFEQCYAQPNCTPTRVQLMTGLSNVRNYVDFGTLDRSATTFGHLFSRAGYATAIVGKWQLGSKDAGLPKHFGFDEHCLWALMGRGERYADPSLSINGDYKTLPGRYGPDVCQQFAIDFVRKNRDRPFLLYYPMILTHGRYEPTPDSQDYGRERAKGKAANQRYFAEMVAYADKQVGGLVRELEALGLREDTLILFTGDNGTGHGVTSDLQDGGQQDGEKGNTTRGGMHVPLVVSWPGKAKAGAVCPDLVDMTDVLPTLCEAAKVPVPETLKPDGRSFLSQVRGEKGDPREWVYSYWVPLRENQTAHLGKRGAVEQAFDRRFKLYSTGEFYDTGRDPEEKAPLPVAGLTGDAAAAARKLQAALDQYKDARPAQMPDPRAPGAKKRRQP
ncbi:MAG TPA: sulfatase-like hydrolase/transferase [Humisphaera sp.]